MSLLDHLTNRVSAVGSNYVTGKTIDIRPSYPSDITSLPRPAIIVQKVTSKNKRLGFGNFLGQYFDKDTNTTYDVEGIKYVGYFDIIVDSDGNIGCQLLTDMIIDDVNDNSHIDLKDFTVEPPEVVGSISIDREIDVTNLNSDETKDYRSMSMIKVTSIRHRIPQTEMVDMSKLIKWNQTIRL